MDKSLLRHNIVNVIFFLFIINNVNGQICSFKIKGVKYQVVDSIKVFDTDFTILVGANKIDTCFLKLSPFSMINFKKGYVDICTELKMSNNIVRKNLDYTFLGLVDKDTHKQYICKTINLFEICDYKKLKCILIRKKSSKF